MTILKQIEHERRRAIPAWTGAFFICLATHVGLGQVDPHRGLWVGQATLNAVNEVTIPLDENNNAIAPDPNKPTSTRDAAYLRLIFHVNGAGQTSLLKDVAILNRSDSITDPNVVGAQSLLPAGESDLALVTDESLYGTVPPQAAIRIARAVFDFGDSRATDGLDAVVDAVVDSVATSVNNDTGDLDDPAARVALRDSASALAEGDAAPIVAGADVAVDFDNFVRTVLTSGLVDEIAAGNDPGTDALDAAEDLRDGTPSHDGSFYGDERAVDMVNGILAAVSGAAVGEEQQAARNAAASFADVDNRYQRFIAGKQFGDMIVGAAATAAAAAIIETPLATPTSIREAVDFDQATQDARDAAPLVEVAQFDENRPTDAVEVVLDAIIAAAAALPPGTTHEADVQSAAEQAGRVALRDIVMRYPIPPDAPTPDYNDFIQSDDFQESAAVAALGAAVEAISEKRNNALHTLDSLRGAARVGAANALRNAYAAAARAQRTELPMDGSFAPGSGDTRAEAEIGVSDTSLGAAGLFCELILPANHPTNPFRHRRHPDHTTGFSITRRIRLDFDGVPSDPLARAGFGVDRITGVYREEIHGLHKPLGPDPNNAPIGLKVEGRFELNRISLIDALNAL